MKKSQKMMKKMGVLSEQIAELQAGPCLRCLRPPRLCECPADEADEDAKAGSIADNGSSVAGTETLSLGAGHTCDFEYLTNLAKRGIPFTFDDILKYDALLQNSGPDNIDAVIDIGARAYMKLQQNGPSHEGGLLRGLVSVWGIDLDENDYQRKLKADPTLKNEPDAAFKAALGATMPAPAAPKPGFTG